MLVKDAFRIDGKKINKKILSGIYKIWPRAHFLSNYGLVSLRENQIDDFDWWKKIVEKLNMANGPDICSFPYLPEKIFRQDRMVNWQNGRVPFGIWKVKSRRSRFPFFARINWKESQESISYIHLDSIHYLQMRWGSVKPCRH